MDTMMRRPNLHDFVKEAMDGTIAKIDIAAEAQRQLESMGAPTTMQKTASAQAHEVVPTDFVEKLAGALDHLADEQMKLAGLGPGSGPNALHVSSSPTPSALPGPGGMGKARHQPDAPASSSSGVAKDPATGLATNMSSTVAHGKPANMSEKKAEAAELEERNLAVLSRLKEASAGPALEEKNLAVIAKLASTTGPILDRMYDEFKATVAKLAEDAINPAHISAGPAAPPSGTASGEGVPSEPSDVTSQKRMIASNEAAINYTKGEAKADPKSDLSMILTEPALSSSTDRVLQEAFDASSRAGSKIASAEPTLTQSAAASAYLQKLAEMQVKGKEKKSNMPGGYDLSTPSGQSGFKAAPGGA
jgi:hypothetical protein